MARNHFPKQRLDTKAAFNQKYIPIYGPSPSSAHQKATLFHALRRRPGLSLSVLALALTGLKHLWATTGYRGSEILLRWLYEIFAGILSLLAIFLWGKFRRWGKARLIQEAKRTQYSQEVEVIPGNVPPTITASARQKQEEFTLVIDYWVSSEPVRLSEQHAELAQLPDEFLAPDALILNFHFSERLS